MGWEKLIEVGGQFLGKGIETGVRVSEAAKDRQHEEKMQAMAENGAAARKQSAVVQAALDGTEPVAEGAGDASGNEPPQDNGQDQGPPDPVSANETARMGWIGLSLLRGSGSGR